MSGERGHMKRFITQTGLGDSIFALPLAMALESEKIESEIYTGAPEFFAGLEYVKAVKVPALDSEANRKFDGVRLKYDRYRGSYFDSYYHAHGLKTDLVEAQEMAALHLLRNIFTPYTPPNVRPYVVAGAPRLPARHKEKKQCGDEGSSVVYDDVVAAAKRAGHYIIAVGKNETYTWPSGADFDATDLQEYRELIFTVAYAEYVISQVSFLTALAGCLGVPVKFIPGVHETPERFERHVQGVTWKKNLRAEAPGTVLGHENRIRTLLGHAQFYWFKCCALIRCGKSRFSRSVPRRRESAARTFSQWRLGRNR